MSAVTSPRADLFRLLGDEDRLRLLALCGEEELTVGELATLLGESQPQVSKKSQPLRDAGLLAARREGTRTLLSARQSGGLWPLVGQSPTSLPVDDPVLGAAFAEGRKLCVRDGSLSRVAQVVAQRDEASRRYFEEPPARGELAPVGGEALTSWLPLLAPLLPGRGLAVDVGTGEGSLLPLLSSVYERVIAIDRSPARLARCAARIAGWGLPNVRLREGSVGDVDLTADVASRGGADLALMARVLHHVARPQDVVTSAARLVRPGGHLIVVELLPHDDESLREQGHVWLGFEPAQLSAFLERAGLDVIALAPLPDPHLHFAIARLSGGSAPRPAKPGEPPQPETRRTS